MSELTDLVNTANDFITKTFDKKEGSGVPMWHLQTSDGKNMLVATPFGDGHEKDMVVSLLKEMITEKDVVRFVFMSEAWIKSFPKESKWSELPDTIQHEADKQEAVVFWAEDKETGERITQYRMIDRVNGDAVIQDEIHIIKDMWDSRFGNMFGQTKRTLN